MQNKIPFIEIRISHIRSTDIYLKMEILTKISNRFQKNPGAEVIINSKEEEPYIRIIFKDIDSLIIEYSRGYELLNLILDNISELNEIIVHEEQNNQEDLEEEIFLVLNYTTNNKGPLRKYYEFASKMASFFNVKMTIEEIDDGFLWFYKTKADFEAGQMEFRDLEEIKQFFLSRNQWTEEIERLFESYFEKK